MECDRVPYTLLKFKVGVVEEVFIGFARDGFFSWEEKLVVPLIAHLM